MTKPATYVGIGFGLLPHGDAPANLTLDHATAGVLDDAAFPLAGDTLWSDVTQFVRSVTISRGRSSELDRYRAGTINIVLDNRDRNFDPVNTLGAYYPDVLPRRPISVTAAGVDVFRGTVEEWGLDFTRGQDATATASGVDGFALLARQKLAADLSPPEELAGARVGRVLDLPEVAWPGGPRQIDAGVSWCNDVVAAEGDDVLAYLQQVEATESGDLFIGAAGDLVFKDRTTGPGDIEAVTFADDDVVAGSVPYLTAEVTYSTDLIYNQVTVTPSGGTAQQATDADSQSAYGVSALNLTSLHRTDADALDLAGWLVGVYKTPLVRFASLSVELATLDATRQAQVLGLDLGDVVTVRFQPSPSGGAAASSPGVYVVKVQGIKHEIGKTTHRVVLEFTPAQGVNSLVLDDSTFGLLDTGLLGY